MRTREHNPRCADLVVLNGRLLTFDLAQLHAEAMATVGTRIACVGANQDIWEWVGNKTQIVNANGNTVLPGFIDSHVHFRDGGFGLSGVQLRDAATPEEFIRRISEYASRIPNGEWILGGRWNHELWPGSLLPTKEWIDGYTPNNPVLISRYDGHMVLANSLALQLAGIARDTVAPPGGTIERGPTGELTGLLKDEAISLAQKVVPNPSEDQLTRAMTAALAEARRYGITGIHDNANAEDFAVYQKLYERGELTCRIYCMMPIRHWKSLADIGVRAAFGNDWIRIGALKGFADGSLGSSTALFFEPYSDTPHNSGLAGADMLPEGNMLKMVQEADRAGLQVCIHAIGDRANHLVLDMYEAAVKANRRNAEKRRFRIEHAQHLHPNDIAKFASLGVIASMQPVHLVDDGCWAEKRIGHERCRTTYAFRTLLDHDIRLAFGSDWTVAPLNPLLGIHAAITRQTSDGKHPGGWFPTEKITLEEAVKAYTMGSAYAEFAENEKGSLTAGKLADIVVLDAHVFAVPLERLKEIKVLCTIAGGKVVYQADNFQSQ
jgi:predicted amidohydrolase YtcJ